jgi:hypothetical protein
LSVSATPTVLLTLGRLPKALELARALHAAGCRVIVAEPFGWHICRLSRAVARSFRIASPNRDKARFLDDLAGIVERERVDIVVPVSEEALHVVDVQARLPDGVCLYSPPAATLHELHDKLLFARLATRLGLAVPLTEPHEAPAAVTLAANTDFIVKPRHSCSGIGFRAYRRGAPVPPVDPLTPAVVQSFVAGEHLSTFSIAHDGKVTGTVIYRGTVFSGTVAVCFERLPGHASIERWIRDFVAGIGYDGFISFDFIVERDRPLAIECNPRLTSGAHFVAQMTLAAAVLGRHEVPFDFASHTLLQQFYPVLTEAQKAMFGSGPFRRNLGQLLSARDVVWSPRDPWPFLLMTPASWELLRLTMFGGQSFGEAATADIAWFGGGPPVNAAAAPGT